MVAIITGETLCHFAALVIPSYMPSNMIIFESLIKNQISKFKPGVVHISGENYQNSAPGQSCEFSALSNVLTGVAVGGGYHAQWRQTTGGG